MNRVLAAILGGFSILPIIYMVYFMSSVGSMGHAQSATEAEAQFDTLFRLHMLTMLLIFSLLFVYIVYLFKTDHVAKDKKALWAVVLFMGSFVSMPIFWFLYVWKPSGKRTEQAHSENA